MVEPMSEKALTDTIQLGYQKHVVDLKKHSPDTGELWGKLFTG